MMAWYSRERSSFKSSARRSREISLSVLADFGSAIRFLLSETDIHNMQVVFYYVAFLLRIQSNNPESSVERKKRPIAAQMGVAMFTERYKRWRSVAVHERNRQAH